MRSTASLAVENIAGTGWQPELRCFRMQPVWIVSGTALADGSYATEPAASAVPLTKKRCTEKAETEPNN